MSSVAPCPECGQPIPMGDEYVDYSICRCAGCETLCRISRGSSGVLIAAVVAYSSRVVQEWEGARLPFRIDVREGATSYREEAGTGLFRCTVTGVVRGSAIAISCFAILWVGLIIAALIGIGRQLFHWEAVACVTPFVLMGAYLVAPAFEAWRVRAIPLEVSDGELRWMEWSHMRARLVLRSLPVAEVDRLGAVHKGEGYSYLVAVRRDGQLERLAPGLLAPPDYDLIAHELRRFLWPEPASPNEC